MKIINKSKNIILFLLCFFVMCSILACQNKNYNEYYLNDLNPIELSKKSNGDLDFIELHNYVMDNLGKEMNPFFFIKEGEFDIDGDNEKKEISLTFNCMQGTTEQDAALFIVWVTKLIGNGASEQDTAYNLSTDETYGSVFDTWNFVINGKLEGKDFIKINVKAGEKMPYDARYVKDLTTDEDDDE